MVVAVVTAVRVCRLRERGTRQTYANKDAPSKRPYLQIVADDALCLPHRSHNADPSILELRNAISEAGYPGSSADLEDLLSLLV